MKSTKQNYWIIILLVIFLVAISAVSFNILKPNKEKMTELYFEDHINLPTTYEPGHDYPFSFTIHNLEYKTTSYEYEIVAASASGSLVLSQNKTTLKHDEYKTFKETFNLATGSGRTNIQVHLIHKTPMISLWVEELANKLK